MIPLATKDEMARIDEPYNYCIHNAQAAYQIVHDKEANPKDNFVRFAETCYAWYKDVMTIQNVGGAAGQDVFVCWDDKGNVLAIHCQYYHISRFSEALMDQEELDSYA